MLRRERLYGEKLPKKKKVDQMKGLMYGGLLKIAFRRYLSCTVMHRANIRRGMCFGGSLPRGTGWGKHSKGWGATPGSLYWGTGEKNQAKTSEKQGAGF